MKRTILAVLVAASFGVSSAYAAGGTAPAAGASPAAKPASTSAAMCRPEGTTGGNTALPACAPKTGAAGTSTSAAPAAKP